MVFFHCRKSFSYILLLVYFFLSETKQGLFSLLCEKLFVFFLREIFMYTYKNTITRLSSIKGVYFCCDARICQRKGPFTQAIFVAAT